MRVCGTEQRKGKQRRGATHRVRWRDRGNSRPWPSVRVNGPSSSFYGIGIGVPPVAGVELRFELDPADGDFAFRFNMITELEDWM